MAFSTRRRRTFVQVHGLAAAFVAGATLAAPGCAPNQVSFGIIQNQLPQPGGINGQCVTSSEVMTQTLGSGTLDLALRDNYVMNPLYQSELDSYRDFMAGRPETRQITVDGARIQLFTGSPTGTPVAPEFTTTTVTTIPAANIGGEGYAAGTLVVIPSEIGDQLQPIVCNEGLTPVTPPGCVNPTFTPAPLLVIARITPFGHTMGGTQLDGATFMYPIQVCCGCLVAFPADADSSTVPGPDCSEGIATTQACVFGQDSVVDCRTCSAANPFCQPRLEQVSATMSCVR